MPEEEKKTVDIDTSGPGADIDIEEFFQCIKEQATKDKLIKLTNDAFEKEVFGTPTFIVNNKIFWGQDRLEYALEEFNTY